MQLCTLKLVLAPQTPVTLNLKKKCSIWRVVNARFTVLLKESFLLARISFRNNSVKEKLFLMIEMFDRCVAKVEKSALDNADSQRLRYCSRDVR